MAKTLFIDDNDTEKIDIGDNFFIEIPIKIKAGIAIEIAEKYKDESSIKSGVGLLSQVALSWNLTEKDGTPAELTEKNFLRLPIETLQLIIEKITDKMTIDKKKSKEQKG